MCQVEKAQDMARGMGYPAQTYILDNVVIIPLQAGEG
jgi:hypothetical protein